LIGPISGPLVAGIVINWRDGRPGLAAMYGFFLLNYAIFLPVVTAKLGLSL
jgi:hypothetical protein